MPDLSELDARFARLAGEYEQRRATAYAAVVRWHWYSWHAYDLRPLHYERALLKPGRRLAERPPLDRDHDRIGFDAQDRPVVMLEYSGFLDGKLYYETYREYLTDRGLVEEAHFSADRKPIYLHEYRFDGGLIRAAWSAASGGGGYETYEYAGSRVTRIAIYHAAPTGRPGRRLHPPAPYQVINAEYDDAGLSRLEIEWQGAQTELKYQRPPDGFTVERACRQVHRELVRQIPAAVRGLTIDAPAYCVALAYQHEDPLDFRVQVGLDEQRRAWLADRADEQTDEKAAGIEEIWSPAELGEELPVELGTVAGTARLLGQEWSLADAEDITAPTAPGGEGARELFCAVAAELNTADWAQLLPITDDFVVYAVDVELADLDRNMPACLPPTRLALLHDRGLL